MFNKRILLLISLVALVIGFSPSARALWLSGYEYRKEFTVNGSSDGNLSDYQLLLNVYKGSGTDSGNSVYLSSVKDDFSDIRFTNSAGDELDYWIETKTDGNNAQVWIEFGSLPLSASTDFYLYYSNESAFSASNGFDTFIQFDDFERGNDGDEVGGSWTELNGIVEISTTQDIGDTDGYYGTRSMKIEGVDGVYSTATIAQPHDDYGINFQFFKESEAYLRRIPACGDATHRVEIWILKNGSILYLDDSGWIDTGVDVASDEWEMLECRDFDWTNHTYDIYLNDGIVANDIAMRSDPLEDTIWLQIEPTAGDDGWIDNFIVRNFTSDEPIWQSWGSEEGVIPEPASLLLLGFGVFGVAIFKKRLI